MLNVLTYRTGNSWLSIGANDLSSLNKMSLKFNKLLAFASFPVYVCMYDYSYKVNIKDKKGTMRSFLLIYLDSYQIVNGREFSVAW